MCKLALVLACSAFLGHARRFQAPADLQSTVDQLYEEAHAENRLSPSQSLALFLLALKPSAAFSLPGLKLHHSSHLSKRTSGISASADDAPPPLPDSSLYSRGSIESIPSAWWRQSAKVFQIVYELPDDVSAKRDVNVEFHKDTVDLSVAGTSILKGKLPYNTKVDESDWQVEQDFKGFDGERYLIVDLVKQNPFVDWPAPLFDPKQPTPRVLLGGLDGNAQPEAIAQQIQSWQMMKSLPATVINDVYARPPNLDPDNATNAWFLGKVSADQFIDGHQAFAAQEIMIKEHARRLLPDIFHEFEDEEIDIYLGPKNTEILVAQGEANTTRWLGLPEGKEMPPVGLVGFSPEVIGEDEIPFVARLNEDGTNALPKSNIKVTDIR